jgi:hypothetical protein
MNKTFFTAAAALGLAGATSSCVSEPTVAARAAAVQRYQCLGPRESEDELRILRETTVVHVAPITFFTGAGTRSEGGQRVSGVKLLVRAPDGVSYDQMARALQCHSAKVLLGQVDVATLGDDPYVLPDTWLDIEVTPDRGYFAVKLSADRVYENLALFRRETAFAGAHRIAAAP